MAQTFIVKGDVVTNPSDNDFGRAVFVRITATADVTGILELANGSNDDEKLLVEINDMLKIKREISAKLGRIVLG